MSGIGTKTSDLILLGISLLAFMIRVVITFSVIPLSDVFYVTKEATVVLQNFQNPYLHTFSSVPHELLTLNSEAVFPYLPFSLIYLVPFQFLTSEIRLGLAFSDAITVFCLGRIAPMSKRRAGIILAMIYAFSPPLVLLSPLYGNNVTVGICLFVVSLFFWQRDRPWLAGICYGLSLASSHFVILSAPFIYVSCYRSRKLISIYFSWASFLLIILPFLLHDAKEFIGDLVFFQLDRPALPLVYIINSHVGVNLGFSGLAMTLGYELPLILKMASVVVLLAALLAQPYSASKPLRNAFFFILVTVMFLPSMVFYSYYLFPVVILMLHLVERDSIIQSDMVD